MTDPFGPQLKLSLQEAFPKSDLFYGLTVGGSVATAILQTLRILVYFDWDPTLLKEGWDSKEYKVLIQPLVVLGVIALLNLADKFFFYNTIEETENSTPFEISHLLFGLVIAFKVFDLFSTEDMKIGRMAWLFPVALYSALSQIFIGEFFFGPAIAIGAVLSLVQTIIKGVEGLVEGTLRDEVQARLGYIYEDQVLSVIFTASIVFMIVAPADYIIRLVSSLLLPLDSDEFNLLGLFSPNNYFFFLYLLNNLVLVFTGVSLEFDFRLLYVAYGVEFLPQWIGVPFLLCYGIFEAAPHLKYDIEPVVEDIKNAGFLILSEENPEEKALGWLVEALTWGLLLWSVFIHNLHLTDPAPEDEVNA